MLTRSLAIPHQNRKGSKPLRVYAVAAVSPSAPACAKNRALNHGRRSWWKGSV